MLTETGSARGENRVNKCVCTSQKHYVPSQSNAGIAVTNAAAATDKGQPGMVRVLFRHVASPMPARGRRRTNASQFGRQRHHARHTVSSAVASFQHCKHVSSNWRRVLLLLCTLRRLLQAFILFAFYSSTYVTTRSRQHGQKHVPRCRLHASGCTPPLPSAPSQKKFRRITYSMLGNGDDIQKKWQEARISKRRRSQTKVRIGLSQRIHQPSLHQRTTARTTRRKSPCMSRTRHIVTALSNGENSERTAEGTAHLRRIYEKDTSFMVLPWV